NAHTTTFLLLLLLFITGKVQSPKKGKQFSEIESIVGEDSSAEMDGGGGGDHLTSEEVVNCTCKRLEEDGLMIQCDSCLCWQHGACISIFEEEQVPEKHVCSVCRNPPGSRHPSSRMLIDQDFLKEGKLIYLPGQKKMSSSSSLVSREEAFRKLSDLMSDLLSLNRVLHSLRIKISVASQKNSSKVFMWSSPWISPHTPSRKGGEDDPMVAAAATPSQEVLTTPLTPHHESLLLNDLNNAEGGEDLIDPSMIPSVSEVEELLPSIIQGLPTEEFEEEQPVPLPNIIPEPKRIDKDESRCNLIQHIDDVQCELEERLNLLEENLCILEKKEEEDSEQILYDAVHADCAKTKAVIQMLLLDLSTGKTLLGTL
ncbi:PHD finger protein 20like, partial [Caligus rogercresseyi]